MAYRTGGGGKGRINVIGALLGASLLTICRFDCHIDGQIFCAWAQQDLLPELPKGSVVSMDNTAFHKGHEAGETIEEAGFWLEYLPPYSPVLNLI